MQSYKQTKNIKRIKSGLIKQPIKPIKRDKNVLFLKKKIKKRIKINSTVRTEKPKIDDQVKPRNR